MHIICHNPSSNISSSKSIPTINKIIIIKFEPSVKYTFHLAVEYMEFHLYLDIQNMPT